MPLPTLVDVQRADAAACRSVWNNVNAAHGARLRGHHFTLVCFRVPPGFSEVIISFMSGHFKFDQAALMEQAAEQLRQSPRARVCPPELRDQELCNALSQSIVEQVGNEVGYACIIGPAANPVVITSADMVYAAELLEGLVPTFRVLAAQASAQTN